MVSEQWKSIENQVEEAATTRCWTIEQNDTLTFLREVRQTLKDFEERLFKSKSNLEEMKKMLEVFLKTTLYVRSENRHDCLLIYSDKENRVGKRNNELREIGERCKSLIDLNRWLFNADENSLFWKIYLDFVDDSIVESLFEIVEFNLDFLLQQTDPKFNKKSLFEVKIVLRDKKLSFDPDLNFGSGTGLHEIFDSIIGNIFRQPAMIEHRSFRVETKIELKFSVSMNNFLFSGTIRRNENSQRKTNRTDGTFT